MDKNCEIIKRILIPYSKAGLKFKDITDKLELSDSKLSEPTISKHLQHLVSGHIIQHDKTTKRYSYDPHHTLTFSPPYKLIKSEIELELKEDAKTRKHFVHHIVSYTIQNPNKDALTSLAIHIYGDTPKKWEDLHIKLSQQKDSTTIPISSKKESMYFETTNDFRYRFQLIFPLPLYHNETTKIKYEYDWGDDPDTYFVYDPTDNRPEEFNFKLSHPTTKNYLVNAFKVIKSTLVKEPLNIPPKVKTQTTQKVWEWKLNYDPEQNYHFRVEWKLI